MLGKAVPAVYGSSFRRFEGNLTFFSTVGTDSLCHLTGAKIPLSDRLGVLGTGVGMVLGMVLVQFPVTIFILTGL